MEQDEEMARHLLGSSLMISINEGICSHDGHMPFTFGRRIELGKTDLLMEWKILYTLYLGFDRNAVFVTDSGKRLCAKVTLLSITSFESTIVKLLMETFLRF